MNMLVTSVISVTSSPKSRVSEVMRETILPDENSS